jgi:hypothetical protein
MAIKHIKSNTIDDKDLRDYGLNVCSLGLGKYWMLRDKERTLLTRML